MSLYRRNDSPYWWVKFTVNGHRVQRSTGTADRKSAQHLCAKWQMEAWNQRYLGVKPEHLWEEAVVRWLSETEHRASRATDRSHLRWLQPHLEGRAVRAIDRDRIEHLIEVLKKEGASNTLVNRRMAIVRAILRKAHLDWDWLEQMPRFRKLKEPPGRERYLTLDEARRVLEELPDHQREMMLFALATGLRQGNVKRLRWSWVHMERRLLSIPGSEMKARKPIGLPLDDLAMGVLVANQGRHPEYVFSYKGKPVTQVGTKAWRGALERAQLEDVRWHDLRHTWASWHAQRGTPFNVLQTLGAWKTADMVRRYAHLSVEHLREFVDRTPSAVLSLAQLQGYETATPEGVAEQ